MEAVRQWLEQLGLVQYTEVFAKNDVDLETLRQLTEGDLEKLGVTLRHQKKLLLAKRGQRDAARECLASVYNWFAEASTRTTLRRRVGYWTLSADGDCQD